MNLFRLVIKDITQRKRRVAYATLGVVIGTMTVVAVLTISQAGQAKITGQLEKYGANLAVTPAVNSVNMELGGANLGALTIGDNYIQEENVSKIQTIADREIRAKLDVQTEGNIATVAPKLYVASSVSGAAVTLVGIDPQAEYKLKSWWMIDQGNYIKADNEVVLGSVAAQALKLQPGSTVSIKGKDWNVAGILTETGSNDDYEIFLPLAGLQNMFDKQGIISSIDVRALCNACPVEIIATAINNELTGLRAVAVKQVASAEMGMLEKINRMMLALGGVTLIVGGFGVANTMMTSVQERTKDLGIMRAVGASRGQITKVLIYEAVIVGIAGGLLGYGAGSLLAFGMGPIILEGTSMSFAFNYFPVSVALAIFIAVVATLYPALRATRIKVSDSFRAI